MRREERKAWRTGLQLFFDECPIRTNSVRRKDGCWMAQLRSINVVRCGGNVMSSAEREGSERLSRVHHATS